MARQEATLTLQMLESAVRRRATPLAVVALVALSFLFQWRLFTPDRADATSYRTGTFSERHYAPALALARRLAVGEWPLWCPYAFGGRPCLGSYEGTPLYPPRLLTVLLASPWGFPYVALEAEATMHLALAAALAFALGRRLFANDGAAAVAAITYAFGGYLTGHATQDLTQLEAAAWLPLAILCAGEAVVRRRALNRWTAGLGLAVALAVLAGDATIAAISVALACAYALWHAPRRRSLTVLALALALALGLTAARWLPALEFAFEATVATAEVPTLTAGASLVQVLLPPHEGGYSPLYAGILPLTLIAAALAHRKERPVRFWLQLLPVALLLSLAALVLARADAGAITAWVLRSGLAERLPLLVTTSTAILSGYGARSIFATEATDRTLRRVVRWAGALAWLLLAAVIAFFLGLLKDGWTADSPFFLLMDKAVFATIVATAGWALLREAGNSATPGDRNPAFDERHAGDETPECASALPSAARASRFFIGACALLVFDLFTVNWQDNFGPVPPDTHENAPSAIAAIRADNVVGGPYRVFQYFRLPEGFGTQFGIEDIWGAGAQRLVRYELLLRRVPLVKTWSLLGVRYVLAGREDLPVPTTVVYQQGDGDAFVHRLENPGALAWLVHRVEVLPGDMLLEHLAAPAISPADVALLEQSLPMTLTDAPGVEQVELLERRPERLSLRVTTGGNALLVLSEIHYPGWLAALDGEPAPVLRADYVLRAVPVPAGKHTVTLVYRPIVWTAGLAISTLTLLGALALASWAVRRNG